ncbi:MAG TPA: DUF2993 domain-containing protein [Selenomonadales bacterium]|nr:DUF2993 domain-containing protein [Selenomonadales bacterium]
MVKRLSIIVVILLALFAGEELLLPRFVSTLIAHGMTQAAGTDQIEAQVSKRPAFLMLGGRFDSVRILARDAKVDKIAFSELDTALTNVELDMNALMTRKAVAIKSVGDIDLTAVITQDELTRYLNQSVKGIRNVEVAINDGKVQVSGKLTLSSIASLAVTLDGKIVGDGQKIKFVTERFLLNNASVGNFGGTLLTEIPLVDMKKLPFGTEVRSITSENGKITIYADNRGK